MNTQVLANEISMSYVVCVFLSFGFIPFFTIASCHDFVFAGDVLLFVNDNVTIDAFLTERHAHQASNFCDLMTMFELEIDIIVQDGFLMGLLTQLFGALYPVSETAWICVFRRAENGLVVLRQIF